MDDETRDMRSKEIYDKILDVKSRTDFYDFMVLLLEAWREGVFDNNDEGQKQDVADYLDGIVGVMYDETIDISPEEDLEKPNWARIAWILNTAFYHT